MIQDNIAYDPQRDLAPVDQFGFIELRSALSEGVVPSQMPGSDVDYDGAEEPDQILGRPRDIFEAIDAQKALEAAAAANTSEGGKDE